MTGGSGPRPEAAGGSGPRLRIARQARGYSQQQLAGMAGVSRQAVSAVESGQSDPSLRVALALAHALGLSVEEMFGPGTPAPAVAARPLAPLGPAGSRLVLAQLGESFVALPLSGAAATRTGFGPAGGLVGGGPVPGDEQPARQAGPSAGLLPAGSLPAGSLPAGQAGAAAAGPARLVRPIGPPRPTLVVAGCDPALPLLETPLGLLDPPVAFAWWPCSSTEALALAAGDLVHVAGAHLRGSSGDYNTGPAAQLLRHGAEVIAFSSWREGLVLAPGLAGSVGSVADLVRAGLRVVNRDPGAEARRLLDRELASRGIDAGQLAGYRTQATGHLQVAQAIAAGLADAGIASEPAALAYGLGFVPLASERFDLIIPAARAVSREVQGLLRVLSAPWLLDQLASLPGYDPSRCGEKLATLAPAPSDPSGLPG